MLDQSSQRVIPLEKDNSLMNSDKKKVWAALSCWTKDLDEGHRAISWEIVSISKSKTKISEGAAGFPNQQAQ